VATDSYHQVFEPAGRFAGFGVERRRLPPSSEPPRRSVQNERGPALHLESRRGAEALATFDPDCVIPMHCSGETLFDAARQAMPGRVARISTGTRFVFGA